MIFLASDEQNNERHSQMKDLAFLCPLIVDSRHFLWRILVARSVKNIYADKIFLLKMLRFPFTLLNPTFRPYQMPLRLSQRLFKTFRDLSETFQTPI